MSARNPLRRQIAIVGLGATDYGRDLGRSRGDLALEACRSAIADAGLNVQDVDGVAVNMFQKSPQFIQAGLGIRELSWWAGGTAPFTFGLSDAINAVHSGACEIALALGAPIRTGSTSASAAGDPFRVQADPARQLDRHGHSQYYKPFATAPASYMGYMRRYMYEFGVDSEAFGRIAINSRTGASKNERAVFRKPLTMEGYLDSPIVRDPMRMLDMDVPIDGADACIVTTAQRAADTRDPVYVAAVAYGQSRGSLFDDCYDLRAPSGQDVAARNLRDRYGADVTDADVVMAYDGFTIITLKWLEAMGFCGLGAAGDFVASNWSKEENRIRINGRVPMNPHGGSLSEGGTQGAGHVREAITQLRGDAGPRQVTDASRALVMVGGFYNNATALVLER